MAEESVEEVLDFEVELTEEAISEVEKSVLEAHKGKAKDELSAEIESAKAEKVKALKEESKAVFDKIKELSAKDENKGKTPQELQELAVSELSKGTEEEDTTGGENPSLDEDFIGVAGKFKKEPKVEASPSGVELPEDIKAELEEYRQLKADKALLTFLDAKKSGTVADFDDMYKKAGLHINPATIPAEDLYMHSLIELQKVDATITKEEIEEKINEFKELDKFEKAEKVAPLRARLDAELKAAKETFFGQMTERTSSAKVDSAKEVASVSEELKGTYLGKRFYGVDMDERTVNELVSNYRKGGLRVTTPDGKLDVQRTVFAHVLMEKYAEITDAAFKRGSKEATRKGVVQRSKPSSGIRVKGLPSSLQKSDKKEFEDAWARHIGKAVGAK